MLVYEQNVDVSPSWAKQYRKSRHFVCVRMLITRIILRSKGA